MGGGKHGVRDRGRGGVRPKWLVSLQGRVRDTNFLVGVDMPSSTWPFSVLKRPLLIITSLRPFKLHWPPTTMGLGSERPADFVRLFKLWYMVQCTGTSLRLGRWIVAVGYLLVY